MIRIKSVLDSPSI